MQTKTVLLPVLLVSWLVLGVGVQEKQPNKGEIKQMSNTGNFELLTPNTMPKAVGYSQLATVTGGRSYSLPAKLHWISLATLWARTTSEPKFNKSSKT